MSTVKATSYYDKDGTSNAVLYGVAAPTGSMGFRNRIINGDMRIDQRNAGASVTMSTSVAYTVDRWFSYEDTDGVMTAQQNTSAPTGFTNSLKCTTTTADASLAATQRVIVGQRIEGFNVADLGWGTASAQAVTLSFWVRSSLTGTFGGAVNNQNNRSYPFTYAISVADTWEQKTITIPGDTSGTWSTNSSTGIQLVFGLGVGSTYSGTAGAWAGSDLNSATGATSVIGTLNATWYITGVQLEAGSVASPFERRDYGRELIMCQRYYQLIDTFTGVSSSATVAYGSCLFQVPMRAAPSIAAAGILRITDGYSADFNQSSASAVINSSRVSTTGVSFDAANFTGMTTGRFFLSRQSATASVAMSSEL